MTLNISNLHCDGPFSCTSGRVAVPLVIQQMWIQIKQPFSVIYRDESAGPASRAQRSGRTLAGRGDDLRAEQTGGTGRAAKTM